MRAFAAIILALVVLSIPGAGFSNGVHWFSNATPIRCTEDMSCWNCKTMGNRRCGPAS